MQVPRLEPLVLDADRQRVLAAHAYLFQEKTRIYAQHHKVTRLAAMKRRMDLRKAASQWIEHADMFVSTTFDIVHFRAQIKHRHSIGRLDLVESLEAILEQLKERNKKAKAELPRVTAELKELHDKVAAAMTGNEGSLTIVSGTTNSG